MQVLTLPLSGHMLDALLILSTAVLFALPLLELLLCGLAAISAVLQRAAVLKLPPREDHARHNLQCKKWLR